MRILVQVDNARDAWKPQSRECDEDQKVEERRKQEGNKSGEGTREWYLFSVLGRTCLVVCSEPGQPPVYTLQKGCNKKGQGHAGDEVAGWAGLIHSVLSITLKFLSEAMSIIWIFLFLRFEQWFENLSTKKTSCSWKVLGLCYKMPCCVNDLAWVAQVGHLKLMDAFDINVCGSVLCAENVAGKMAIISIDGYSCSARLSVLSTTGKQVRKLITLSSWLNSLDTLYLFHWVRQQFIPGQKQKEERARLNIMQQ